MNLPRRTKLAIAAAAGLAAVAASIWVVLTLTSGTSADERIVASVNGEPITVTEFEARMADHRADTIRQFSQKYGADPNSPDFWSRPRGGEIPLAVLQQATLDHLVATKIQQLLARDHGIAGDISYAAFRRSLAEENQTRAERVANRQAIFGPQQYTEQAYFRYTFDRIVLDLKATLAESTLTATDEELHAYYERVKESRFKNADTLTVKWLSVCYGAGLSPDRARAEADQARPQLEAADSFDTVAQRIAGETGPDFGYEVRTFQAANRRADLQSYDALLNGVAELPAGQVSTPIHDTDRRCYDLAMVAARVAGGFGQYEEVRQAVRQLYLDERYQAMVEELIRDADVVVHHDVLNQIGPPGEAGG